MEIMWRKNKGPFLFCYFGSFTSHVKHDLILRIDNTADDEMIKMVGRKKGCVKLLNYGRHKYVPE